MTNSELDLTATRGRRECRVEHLEELPRMRGAAARDPGKPQLSPP